MQKPSNYISAPELEQRLQGCGLEITTHIRDAHHGCPVADYHLLIGGQFMIYAGAWGETENLDIHTWTYAVYHMSPARGADFQDGDLIIEDADVGVVLKRFAEELETLTTAYSALAASLKSNQ